MDTTKQIGELQTRFWTFNQNNSGGSFDFDEDAGITHFTIVEAKDMQHAISRAKEIGIYFDGCDAGIDCPCCGDRWYEPWKDDGDEAPTVYGQNVRENGGYANSIGGWMQDGKEICIHPLTGPLEWYGVLSHGKTSGEGA
ncbi:hypothetical protein KCX83_21225 [Brucella oryzae]|uniref:DUF7296 family protein n=1 Tax=Brucella oryzae TaxID=335286 RepID=UPI001B8234CC|nr:hypothetical protein [Brucella oryzae]MBR7654821.1 hypothetical protein [Brucella oryzae]